MKIYNIHALKSDRSIPADAVRVDRTTKWGNPFIIGKDGNRDEVIELYAQWILTQPDLMADLPSLAGKSLLCWCAPERCHAEVLMDLSNPAHIKNDATGNEHEVPNEKILNTNNKEKSNNMNAKIVKCGACRKRHSIDSVKECYAKKREVDSITINLQEDTMKSKPETKKVKCGACHEYHTIEDVKLCYAKKREEAKGGIAPPAVNMNTEGSRPKYFVAFTGHRDIMDPPYAGLRKNLISMISQTLKNIVNIYGGTHEVIAITGGARGFDQDAARVAHSLNIPYIVAVPCRDQDSKWSNQMKLEYAAILKNALEVVMVHDGPYNNTCMDKRNEWMVDRSNVLIAGYDGRPRGGTVNCINYAVKNNKNIQVIWPKDDDNGKNSVVSNPTPKPSPASKPIKEQNNKVTNNTPRKNIPGLSLEEMSTLTDEQYEALQAIVNGNGNVLLTGNAGTGKSHVINLAKKALAEKHGDGYYQVCATTGLAAMAVGGRTYHSYLRIFPKHKKNNEYMTIEELLESTKKDSMTKKGGLAPDLYNLKIGAVKMIIIDEVSMMHRIHILRVNHQLQQVMNNNLPFGGIRMIFVGDFLQLEPVESQELAPINQGSNFAFESPIWKSANIKTIQLTKIIRQKDSYFATFLNNIRLGIWQPWMQDVVDHMSRPAPEGEVPFFTSKNYKVDKINSTKMAELSGESVIIKAKDIVPSYIPQANEYAYWDQRSLTIGNLELKVGALVICLKNGAQMVNDNNLYPHSDDMDARTELVNGDIGMVVGFRSYETYTGTHKMPVIKWNRLNREITLAYNHISEGDPKCYRLQVPVKPCWAMSIHKAQGMTLDAAVIDVNDAFAAGQVYVALSRVRTMDGLYLVSFDKSKIKAHTRALDFYGLNGNYSGNEDTYDDGGNDQPVIDPNNNNNNNGGSSVSITSNKEEDDIIMMDDDNILTGIFEMAEDDDNIIYEEDMPEGEVSTEPVQGVFEIVDDENETYHENLNDIQEEENNVTNNTSNDVSENQVIKLDLSGNYNGANNYTGDPALMYINRNKAVFHGMVADMNYRNGSHNMRMATNLPVNSSDVSETFYVGAYNFAFMNHFFGHLPNGWRIEVRSLKAGAVEMGMSPALRTSQITDTVAIRFSNASFQYNIEVFDYTGWLEAFASIGLIIGNSKKMSKRLAEIVRQAAAFKYFNPDELRIKRLTNAHLTDLFASRGKEFDEKLVDGISAISRSFAISLFKNNAGASQDYIDQQVEDIETGKTSVVMLRILTPDGLIKGNAIILPDHFEILNDCDVVTFDPNVKPEIKTTGWSWATIEPSYGRLPLKSDDLTMSIYKDIDGLVNGDMLLATTQHAVDKFSANLMSDDIDENDWTKEHQNAMSMIKHDDDSKDKNKPDMIKRIAQLEGYIADHGLDITISQTLLYLKINGFGQMFGLINSANQMVTGNTAYMEKQGRWMPVPYAYRAHIMTREVLEIFGYKFKEESSIGFYHKPTHCFVVPGKFFIENYANHGGYDLDDTINVMIRTVVMANGRRRLHAVLMRNPNDFGEWSMIPVSPKEIRNCFHVYQIDPPVVYENELRDKVPQLTDLINNNQINYYYDELPGGAALQIGSVFSLTDETRMRSATSILPGGTGQTVIPKMLSYAITGSYIDNQLVSNEQIIDAVQQGVATDDDYLLIDGFCAEVHNNNVIWMIENNATVDRYWADTRMTNTKVYSALGYLDHVADNDNSPIYQMMLAREQIIRTAYAEMESWSYTAMKMPKIIEDMEMTPKEMIYYDNEVVKLQTAYARCRDNNGKQSPTIWASRLANKLKEMDATEGIEATNRYILMTYKASVLRKMRITRLNHDIWLFCVNPAINRLPIDWFLRAYKDLCNEVVSKSF